MSKAPLTLESLLLNLMKDGFKIDMERELNLYSITVSKWTLGKFSQHLPEDHIEKDLVKVIDFCSEQLRRGAGKEEIL